MALDPKVAVQIVVLVIFQRVYWNYIEPRTPWGKRAAIRDAARAARLAAPVDPRSSMYRLGRWLRSLLLRRLQ